MSPILAQILTSVGLSLLAALLIFFALRAIDRFIDELFPPSHEEITRREAERVAKQATKEFKQRHRLRRLLAWW